MNDVIFRVPKYREQILQELLCRGDYKRSTKDILVVAHNQLAYLERCVQSIRKNTSDFTLRIWDNGSEGETSSWISSQKDIVRYRSEDNLGFIVPNNRMASDCKSDYIVLLNSDTEVNPWWDEAMIAQIQTFGYSQVGYLGGRLDSSGKGSEFAFGGDVDYIPGWCFCIPRSVHTRHGLFDEENLEFCYCEDSDLSLRITESGGKIYSLHLGLVIHHENRTILEVGKTRDCRQSYHRNHDYIRKRHGHRLKCRL